MVGPLRLVDNPAKSDYLIFMKEATITVTEAARSFADCVNRVHYQSMTFVLLKNGKPYARLVPEPPKACSGRLLAAALETEELTPAEFRNWHDDLKSGRKHLKPPGEKWQ